MRSALAILILTVAAQAQAIEVRWDPRIELVSILFHLAETPEYKMNRVPAYAAAVDAYFAAAKSHPAVTMTRELAEKQGIRYFHPMSLAVHLTPYPALAERTPFDAPGHALGNRLQKAPLRAYLEQVRAFVRDADVDTFFALQRPAYSLAEERLRRLVAEHGDRQWFVQYTGSAANTEFLVCPSLLNGGAQYGPTYRGQDATEESYAVIGVYKLDERGLPKFDLEDSDNIVHEFAHTLTNRAVTAHLDALEKSGPVLYARVVDKMRKQAYGTWQTMVYEAVVRAVVVRFIASHRGPEAAAKELASQEESGFTLTSELVELLAEYEGSRGAYPTLDSLMPRVVEVFDREAKR